MTVREQICAPANDHPTTLADQSESKSPPTLLHHGPENTSFPPDIELAISSPANAAKLPSFQYNTSLHPFDHTSESSELSNHPVCPLSAELRVQTGFSASDEQKARPAAGRDRKSPESKTHESQTSQGSTIPVRASSVNSLTAVHLTGGSLSPASAASSPGFGPLSDLTPLPSPVGNSSNTWSKMPPLPEASLSTSASSQSETAVQPRSSPPRKRKAYNGLVATGAEQPPSTSTDASHSRNRSQSDYVPSDAAARARHNAVSGTQTPTTVGLASKPMQREEYLAVQRGMTSLPTPRPPTPPRSNRSATDSSDSGSPPWSSERKDPIPMRYEATVLRTGKTRRWTAIRQLGTGNFSTVMLAASEGHGADRPEAKLERKKLVAVKICGHGPAGGADEERIKSGLKRELEILKTIDHPNLVHLKAEKVLEKRTLMVLTYCPGGDLFELASFNLRLLVPSLVRRIFAELVAAVRYLHGKYIVHRDIKLENILVNLHSESLSAPHGWQSYPHPVVILADFGLGRFIPEPPSSPLLNTRCGSEDYAAPELLMGQEYDGRATDAWALGVLLYAVLEGRLPFDPVPGARRQSPTSHRIARCEWSWVKFAGQDGEWDAGKGKEVDGARECVEGLLRRARNRLKLEEVAKKEWVRGGVRVEGGLRAVEDEEGTDSDESIGKGAA